MKKKDLARELARAEHLPAPAARDWVDEVVDEILRRMKAEEPIDVVSLARQAKAGKLVARPAGGK